MSSLAGLLLWAFAIALGVCVVLGVVAVGLALSARSRRAKKAPERVRALIDLMPSLDLDFHPLTTPAQEMGGVVNGLSALGYGQWKTYQINQMFLLAAIGVHSNGSLAVVYQHALLGQWFEVHARTENTLYLWSSSPAFARSNTPPDVAVVHNPLLTIHDAFEGVNNVVKKGLIAPLTAADAVVFLQEQYRNAIVYSHSRLLSSEDIEGLLNTEGGRADEEEIEQLRQYALHTRNAHLERLARTALGEGDVTSSAFVLHPFSVDGEDVHVLRTHFAGLGIVLPASLPERVAPQLVNAVVDALESRADLGYTIVRKTTTPFLAVALERVDTMNSID